MHQATILHIHNVQSSVKILENTQQIKLLQGAQIPCVLSSISVLKVDVVKM